MTARVIPLRPLQPGNASMATADEYAAAVRLVAEYGPLRALMVARHVIAVALAGEEGDGEPTHRNRVRERLESANRNVIRAMRLVLRRARA